MSAKQDYLSSPMYLEPDLGYMAGLCLLTLRLLRPIRIRALVVPVKIVPNITEVVASLAKKYVYICYIQFQTPMYCIGSLEKIMFCCGSDK